MSSKSIKKSNHAKKLEGIRFTPEIRSIALSVMKLPQKPTVPRNLSIQEREDPNDSEYNVNVGGSARSRALADIHVDEAIFILQDQLGKKQKKNNLHFPIAGIRAIQSLIKNSIIENTTKVTLQNQLEEVLAHSISFSPSSPLLFTPPPHVDNTPENKKFKKRLERLRMRVEEQKYIHLTSNITTKTENDNTAKSMTYAASVGLNMIVAPLSFGAFMYFFSGHLLGWAFDFSMETDEVDIRRVIVAVISGVIMMFIEMILFVIRSYEIDKSSRKKEKKKGLTPFGDYVKSKKI